MIEALLVANVVLWLLVLALAVTVFALARQVGLLHERISPAMAFRYGARSASFGAGCTPFAAKSV